MAPVAEGGLETAGQECARRSGLESSGPGGGGQANDPRCSPQQRPTRSTYTSKPSAR